MSVSDREPFDGVEPGDQVRVTFLDGSSLEGTYVHQSGMHFLHLRGPDYPLIGKVEGPFVLDEVVTTTVMRTHVSMKAERKARSRGEPFPGSAPLTQDDFEYRLHLIGKAIAREQCASRKDELLVQFHDLADQISLAGSKRAWVLGAARWSLTSNQEPTIADIWMADLASPSLLTKPRPTDFNPDPQIRRRRGPRLRSDNPLSVSSVMRSLRAHGINARKALIGNDPECRALIQIDLDQGRKGRFSAEAWPDEESYVRWELSWGGNWSTAGRRHYQKWAHSPQFRLIRHILQLDKQSAQTRSLPQKACSTGAMAVDGTNVSPS